MENEALAGKPAHATVNVERVQRRNVPAEDEEFAKSIGYESLEAMRAQFREQLEEAARQQADDYLERDIVAEIVKRSTVHFPPSMVDQEVAHRIESLMSGLERRNLTMEAYLSHLDKSLADLEAEFAEESRQILTNTLILSHIAHDNDISVSKAEVEEELNRRAAAAGADPKVMRQVMQDQGEMNRLTNSVFIRKVMDYLKSVSKIKEA
jgi:trigger factor